MRKQFGTLASHMDLVFEQIDLHSKTKSKSIYINECY